MGKYLYLPSEVATQFQQQTITKVYDTHLAIDDLIQKKGWIEITSSDPIKYGFLLGQNAISQKIHDPANYTSDPLRGSQSSISRIGTHPATIYSQDEPYWQALTLPDSPGYHYLPFATSMVRDEDVGYAPQGLKIPIQMANDDYYYVRYRGVISHTYQFKNGNMSRIR